MFYYCVLIGGSCYWRFLIGGVLIIGYVLVIGWSGGIVLKYKVYVIWGFYYFSVELMIVNVWIIILLFCDLCVGFNLLFVIWGC